MQLAVFSPPSKGTKKGISSSTVTGFVLHYYLTTTNSSSITGDHS